MSPPYQGVKFSANDHRVNYRFLLKVFALHLLKGTPLHTFRNETFCMLAIAIWVHKFILLTLPIPYTFKNLTNIRSTMNVKKDNINL